MGDISTSEQFDTVDIDQEQNYSVQKGIRKRIIRKIVIVDGKPVETEEIIEDPVDISTSEQFDTGNINAPEQTEILQTQKIIRKQIIKKIVIIDGKPVEVEELVNEPSSTTDLVLQDSVTEDTSKTQNIQDKQVKKIIIIDGKQVQIEKKDDTPKEVCEKIPEENIKPKQASFNLPIPEHANDWMDVIQSGGFSLDDDDDEEEQCLEKTEEKSKEGAVNEVKDEKEKPKPASFNLPIPDHANDFMEVIEGGGFSLDSEDEEMDNEIPMKNKSANIEKSKENPEEKLELLDKSKKEQNVSFKNLEEDWVNVQKLLNKRMTVGQTSKPFKMSDCAKELNVVSEKLNSLPATVKKGDSTVIQKTIITIIEHITVWLEIIEQHVILINNTKNTQEKARLSKFVQDQLVNVTQQLTVLKQTTSTITILRQEVITTVNWCLRSVENQILSIKHSHEQSTEKQIEKPENKSANIEKSKEV